MICAHLRPAAVQLRLEASPARFSTPGRPADANLCTPLGAALLGLALWESQAALHAATIPVTSLNDSGTGSLREALLTAAPGDTVDATGLTGTITLTRGGKGVASKY